MPAPDMTTYMRQYRHEHPEKQREWTRNGHQRRRAIILDLKRGKPCMDCGNQFPPYVMQFDHRPGEEKLFEISNAGNRGRALIEVEVAKCDLVCANCHAIRTHDRRLYLIPG